MTKVRALVAPDMLTKLRIACKMSVEQVAVKLKRKLSEVEAWENGTEEISYPMLEKLAKAYGRHVSVFYLPDLPKGYSLVPPSFRRLPEAGGDSDVSPELYSAIDFARQTRIAACGLMSEMDAKVNPFNFEINIHDSAEDAATKIIKHFGFSQIGLITAVKSDYMYGSLTYYKTAIESKDIMVLQSYKVTPEEMRGFSLFDSELPVICVNGKDTPNARVFTLLHELVHICLGMSALCDIEESFSRSPNEQKVEVFCNSVAANILVPRSELEKQAGKAFKEVWDEAEIKHLASHFGVSKLVIIRRLLSEKLATKQFYEAKQAEYAKVKHKKSSGPIPPDVKAVAKYGKPYARLVVSAYLSKKISLGDAVSYLGLTVASFRKVGAKYGGTNVL